MNHLFTLSYWFDLQPESLTPLGQQIFIGFLVLLVILAVISFAIKIRKGIYRVFFKRLYAFSLTNIAVGLLIFFLNYESVPFLAARFWIAIWFLAMLARLIFMFITLRITSVHKKEREQEEERKKYLP